MYCFQLSLQKAFIALLILSFDFLRKEGLTPYFLWQSPSHSRLPFLQGNGQPWSFRSHCSGSHSRALAADLFFGVMPPRGTVLDRLRFHPTVELGWNLLNQQTPGSHLQPFPRGYQPSARRSRRAQEYVSSFPAMLLQNGTICWSWQGSGPWKGARSFLLPCSSSLLLRTGQRIDWEKQT